jgi:hypothetical protein
LMEMSVRIVSELVTLKRCYDSLTRRAWIGQEQEERWERQGAAARCCAEEEPGDIARAKFLLEKNVDLEARDEDGRTALEHAEGVENEVAALELRKWLEA